MHSDLWRKNKNISQKFCSMLNFSELQSFIDDLVDFLELSMLPYLKYIIWCRVDRGLGHEEKKHLTHIPLIPYILFFLKTVTDDLN